MFYNYQLTHFFDFLPPAFLIGFVFLAPDFLAPLFDLTFFGFAVFLADDFLAGDGAVTTGAVTAGTGAGVLAGDAAFFGALFETFGFDPFVAFGLLVDAFLDYV